MESRFINLLGQEKIKNPKEWFEDDECEKYYLALLNTVELDIVKKMLGTFEVNPFYWQLLHYIPAMHNLISICNSKKTVHYIAMQSHPFLEMVNFNLAYELYIKLILKKSDKILTIDELFFGNREEAWVPHQILDAIFSYLFIYYASPFKGIINPACTEVGFDKEVEDKLLKMIENNPLFEYLFIVKSFYFEMIKPEDSAFNSFGVNHFLFQRKAFWTFICKNAQNPALTFLWKSLAEILGNEKSENSLQAQSKFLIAIIDGCKSDDTKTLEFLIQIYDKVKSAKEFDDTENMFNIPIKEREVKVKYLNRLMNIVESLAKEDKLDKKYIPLFQSMLKKIPLHGEDKEKLPGKAHFEELMTVASKDNTLTTEQQCIFKFVLDGWYHHLPKANANVKMQYMLAMVNFKKNIEACIALCEPPKFSHVKSIIKFDSIYTKEIEKRKAAVLECIKPKNHGLSLRRNN